MISLLDSCCPKLLVQDMLTELVLSSYLPPTQYFNTKQKERTKNKLGGHGLSVFNLKNKSPHKGNQLVNKCHSVPTKGINLFNYINLIA